MYISDSVAHTFGYGLCICLYLFIVERKRHLSNFTVYYDDTEFGIKLRFCFIFIE